MSEHLNLAESERLFLLSEECAEVIKCVSKILRHGYDSHNPDDLDVGDNQLQLTKELGDVQFAIKLLTDNDDVNIDVLKSCKIQAMYDKPKYLHYNLQVKHEQIAKEDAEQTEHRPGLYRVIRQGKIVYVKSSSYFEFQGGLTEPWGKNWVEITADSINDAREKGMSTPDIWRLNK